jgi:putative flippase GtrA
VNPLGIRWLKFNSVGAMGIVVQLAALALFKEWLHAGYLVATALAVEIAVLHNFVWHERFTWKERSGGSAKEVWFRLLRFHAGNGLISVAGNLALMRLLVGWLHVQYLLANLLTIAICSLANFAAGEWFVFRQK